VGAGGGRRGAEGIGEATAAEAGAGAGAEREAAGEGDRFPVGRARMARSGEGGATQGPVGAGTGHGGLCASERRMQELQKGARGVAGNRQEPSGSRGAQSPGKRPRRGGGGFGGGDAAPSPSLYRFFAPVPQKK